MHLKPRRLIPYSYYRTIINQYFENSPNNYINFIRLNYTIIALSEYIIWNYNILIYYNYISDIKNKYLLNLLFHSINYLFGDTRSIKKKNEKY